MQPAAPGLPETPRAAATVVLLRDGPTGLEVFLVQRHGASDVLGGAHVFPGGKVDHTDALLAPAQYLDQPVARVGAKNTPTPTATATTQAIVWPVGTSGSLGSGGSSPVTNSHALSTAFFVTAAAPTATTVE